MDSLTGRVVCQLSNFAVPYFDWLPPPLGLPFCASHSILRLCVFQNRSVDQLFSYGQSLIHHIEILDGFLIIQLFFRRRLGGDNSREFFVCFQDRVAQSVIELAFKFGFGTVI